MVSESACLLMFVGASSLAIALALLSWRSHYPLEQPWVTRDISVRIIVGVI